MKASPGTDMQFICPICFPSLRANRTRTPIRLYILRWKAHSWIKVCHPIIIAVCFVSDRERLQLPGPTRLPRSPYSVFASLKCSKIPCIKLRRGCDYLGHTRRRKWRDRGEGPGGIDRTLILHIDCHLGHACVRLRYQFESE